MEKKINKDYAWCGTPFIRQQQEQDYLDSKIMNCSSCNSLNPKHSCGNCKVEITKETCWKTKLCANCVDMFTKELELEKRPFWKSFWR